MSKKEKSLHEKMKNFFGRRDTTPIDFEGMRVEPYIVSLDTLKDISSENNVSHRLKALSDLYEHILTKKLADYAVEAICKQIEDLLGAHQLTETRHLTFQFYCILINGQLEHMHIMRTYLFRLVARHNMQEDLIPRFEMLQALSQNGKTITNFEEEIGPLLLHWFPDFMASGKTTDFLCLVTNVIKFNAAYLDDYLIEGYIRHVLKVCCGTKVEDDIQESLNILEAILCYSHLPSTVLHSFICILCITVNMEKFVQCSWKQMRNLLGTNIGHTGIYTLCLLLQDRNNYKNSTLVRGAVFFIGMALWGFNKVATLTHPPTVILPSFLKVLDSNEKIIAYEVVLAINKLVEECSDQLVNRSLIWDTLFDITERILLYPEFHSNSPQYLVLEKALQDFITVAEKSCPEDSYENLYKIVEQCSHLRPEQSVIRLVLYKAKNIMWYRPNFIANLNHLLENFFKNERRASVQLEVLKVVHRAREINARFFEDDSIDKTILQNVSHSDTIPDAAVRKAVVALLIVMAESNTSSCFYDILEILEKIMKHMFESVSERSLHEPDVAKVYPDVVTATEGLIHLFKRKLLFMPSNQCIEIFTLLVRHMEQHYENLLYTDDFSTIRKLVLEFFFQLRANKHSQIGVYSTLSVEYSVYTLLDPGESKESMESAPICPPPSSPASLTPPTLYLNYNTAYQILITCLKKEKDWQILEMVFKEIPILLQNKSLIIKGGCSVATLCSTLHTLINGRDHGFPHSLQNAPQGLTKTEVQSHIFPCAAALTSYHSNLEAHIQRILIRCLKAGLVSRSAKVCMEGLTLCILEMQNSMVKLLPDVLLTLSKISATKAVAVSVLEFLSNLIRLPDLYVSFVEDQYMSIFAIALPYTNPFKFNQYTVALAHHVLSMWFLKCRIPFRRDFAKFITTGLRSNLNVPKDSNKASSSKSEEERKADEMTTAAILALHTELMETGLDLMARFTFGMCTNVPQRSPIAEFLLDKGQKTSWLVGNKIVTITTSGCGTQSFKNGLCERCYISSHEMSKYTEPEFSDDSIFAEPDTAVDSGPKAFSVERKRHRSAIQRTNSAVSKEMLSSANQSKDDITLHFQQSGSSARRHTSYMPDTDRKSSKMVTESSIQRQESDDRTSHLCSCWCTSWAEVHIRRPTGNTSWMIKMQNQVFLPWAPPDIPLSILSSLVLPQIEAEERVGRLSPSLSECSSQIESEFKEMSCEGAIDITSGQKSNPPMRRTNSSPDMNTGWFQSFEKETRSDLEDSLELSSDISESKQSSLHLKQPLSQKQGISGKVNTKNLRLDLTLSKDKSLSSSSNVHFERESISSAPIDKRFYDKESSIQQQTSATFRDRGYTISIMSPSRPAGAENTVKKPEINHRSGLSPSFLFLQLFHNSSFGKATYKPLLLQSTEANTRALTVLDHIPPYDTHKIGIVYVGPGQADNEVAILSNVYGSARYVAFLNGLGKIVELTNINPHTTYLGGLDTRGEDGAFALIWHDDVMQVVFHVATFMLNKESDKNRNEKKKHIANCSVMIVYNESGEDFNLSTIKGQVTNACVIIKPEDFNCNIVSVQHKTKELADTFGHTESYIVSDLSLSVFVRQMALHANLASLIISRRQQSAKYAQVSNWLERLRTIKRLRSKILEELNAKNAEKYEFEKSSSVPDYDDFTDYV